MYSYVYGFRFHVNDVLKSTEQSLGWIYVQLFQKYEY